MAASMSSAFTVRRCEPELVAPAKSTPHESRQLSDIDDQEGFRFQTRILQFYRNNPDVQGREPVKVLREALAQTLVLYYPFAGRLREGPGRKLVVDCTGEGVLFIEADADFELDLFGDPIHPPFPCADHELLYNVPGSDGILNCPLLLIQVTRLRCGGFIVGMRLNHTISDAIGFAQFITALSEIARGAHAPSILPIWQRELLNARNPPRITCTHNEYIDATNSENTNTTFEPGRMAHHCFLIGPTELSIIRKFLPPHLPSCSKFELLTACLWQCCTKAFQPDPNEQVRMTIAVNARQKFNPPLPQGYYGNVVANPVALTTAGELMKNPLGYALKLIRDAKAMVTEEYMRSVADMMVIKGRPALVQLKNKDGSLSQTYYVSDLTHVGLEGVDYGWGKAAYAGPTAGWMSDDIPGAAAFYFPFKNKKGEDGIIMLVSLPTVVMERFIVALADMLKDDLLHSRR